MAYSRGGYVARDLSLATHDRPKFCPFCAYPPAPHASVTKSRRLLLFPAYQSHLSSNSDPAVLNWRRGGWFDERAPGLDHYAQFRWPLGMALTLFLLFAFLHPPVPLVPQIPPDEPGMEQSPRATLSSSPLASTSASAPSGLPSSSPSAGPSPALRMPSRPTWSRLPCIAT
ncbi:hypothetical protein C8R44DRAFT_888424 [Mycena epipterygia]|nr:hypothetical protein C8R44DRAFT_888424 [Mycena epipterygia]